MQHRVFAENSGELAVRGSFVPPAEGIWLVVIAHASPRQCDAVQKRGVAGERGEDHGIFGCDLVEGFARDGGIVKNNRADIAEKERLLRRLGGSGDRILQLAPRRVWSVQVEVHGVRRIEIDVVVRVIDARNYRAAGKINLPRVRSGERFDFRGVAGGEDALATDRQSLDVRMRHVTREYLPIQKN